MCTFVINVYMCGILLLFMNNVFYCNPLNIVYSVNFKLFIIDYYLKHITIRKNSIIA